MAILKVCLHSIPLPQIASIADTTASAALKNPTNPDSAVESSSVSVVDQSLAPSVAPGDTTATPDELRFDNNEVFDPLNWMLDGLVDFPSDFPATFPLMGEIGREGMM